MLLNYLKFTLRNFLKFKGYTAINILGLSIGVAVCLLLLAQIKDDLNYDHHHNDVEQLYRVSTNWVINGRANSGGSSESPLARQMEADFPEVVEATRIYKIIESDKFILQYKDKHFIEEKAAFADSNFFEVLKYDFIYGNESEVLDEPFSIVLSKNIAEKLFGKVNPIGKVIQLSSPINKDDFKVTGVFDQDAYSTHLEAGFYAAGNSGKIGDQYYELDEWVALNLYYTYIKLHPEAKSSTVEAALPAWYNKFAAEKLKEYGIEKSHFLQPITDIYLDADVSNFFFGSSGSRTYLYILICIGLFILLIACINFVNLATAKATQRNKEVGVRKVLGASRTTLIGQFLTEAFFYSILAVSLAFFFARLLLPFFNEVSSKQLELGIIDQFPILLGFAALITFLAGAYPALYLSSFDPASTFRDFVGNKLSAGFVKQGLVVLQFVIGIALIQGVFVIREQLNFMKNKELGFDTEAKIVIPLNTTSAQENYQLLRQQLLKHAPVKAVGGTTSYPGHFNPATFVYYKEGQSPEEGSMMLNSGITPEYFDLMGFKLSKGRQFDENRMTADTGRTAVISKLAMDRLGLDSETVLGERISLNFGGVKTFEIIGLMEDFHSESLHSPLEGQIFDWSPAFPLNFAIASIETSSIEASIAALQEGWKIVNPNDPFEYHFLEEQLQEKYLAEQRMSGLIFLATLLAIFISCLGLLGLAAFATERRRKEIGIRKVLGASVSNIVTMLSTDFIRLVGIALVIASPLAWYFMDQWLTGFAFRVDMPWWVFILGAALAVLIAFVTVSLQGLKAALVNPVESLKDE